MLPDNYIRRLKQDLAEAEVMVESKTRYEPEPDFCPPPDDDQPASHLGPRILSCAR
jgi:hypothetical protein